MSLKKYAARLALLGAGLLIGLLFVEGAVRISGKDPLQGILHDPRADRSASECFQIDNITGYSYIPGACETNNHGFPDRDFPIEKPPDAKRYLVLGDSISGDRAFPEFLEQMLSGGPKGLVQVINTGVPGYSTLNEVSVYEKWGEKLDPDGVILQFCLNDYTGTPLLFENEGQVIKVLHHRSERWSRSSWLFSHSGLYRLITYQAQAQKQSMETLFEPVESAISGLRDRLKAEDRKFLVVIFPAISNQWEPGEKKAHQRIVQFLQSKQIHHIDFTDAFFSGGIDNLQFARGPAVFENLAQHVEAFNLPESAVPFLQGQTKKRLLIEKVRAGNKTDTVHPNFLGHYIAAHEITRFVEKRRN